MVGFHLSIELPREGTLSLFSFVFSLRDQHLNKIDSHNTNAAVIAALRRALDSLISHSSFPLPQHLPLNLAPYSPCP